MHIPALPLLSQLLKLLFTILLSQEITIPLTPTASNCYQNPVEVGQVLTKYLSEKFPQCSPQLICDYILQLENATQKTEQEYRVINRDFLIQLKVIIERYNYQQEITNDSVDLFADVKEEAKRQAERVDHMRENDQQEEFERRKAIPGLVGVNEVPDGYDPVLSLVCIY